MNLYPASNARAFIARCYADWLALPTPRKDPVRDFENCLKDARFIPPLPGLTWDVNAAEMPTALANRPNVSKWRCFTVVSLQLLEQIVSQADKDRMNVTFPIDGKPKNPAEFLQQVSLIPKRERHFGIESGQCLGWPVTWFTTSGTVKQIKTACAKAGDDLPGAFCNRLGLGHHNPGTWLVLLSIPGSAVQLAGHYRPTFCDAGTHRWFMVRSSAAGTPPSKPLTWGQTADLEALALGKSSYNGGSERVCFGISASHLGTSKVNFDILGPLAKTHGSPAACTQLANDVWKRRRH